MRKTADKVFAVCDVKDNLDKLIAAARNSPVAIERRGKTVAYVVSPIDREALEDFDLGRRAMEIMKCSKSLGVKVSEAYLRKLLHA